MVNPNGAPGGRVGIDPLVFLHVPKTAGTSLIRMLRALRPWRQILTDQGNITPALLARFNAGSEIERAQTLIFGHAAHGTLAQLGGATLLTVLRAPEDHTISLYLHMLREADVPLHEAACTLGFEKFLRKHWQCLVFQCISLDVPNSATPVSTRESFAARLPAIRQLIDRIDIVGCTDDLDGLARLLAARLGVAPPAVPHLNRSSDFGVAEDQVEELRRAYRHLAQEPGLAGLIAEEQALYLAARARARTDLASWR